jgi:hypothetical protein
MLALLRRWWHDAMGSIAAQRRDLAGRALAAPQVGGGGRCVACACGVLLCGVSQPPHASANFQ